MDRYRDRRSPERERPHYAPPTDSYIPSSNRPTRPRSRSTNRYRPRSRTPPRPQSDTWRARPRSPSALPRHEGRSEPYPSRGFRARSPRRDYTPQPRYDDVVRQSRPRSPISVKRARETSPIRDGRSPPIKRERISSPTREHPRTRSPTRKGYLSPTPASKAEHRPRSRSPARRDDRSEQNAPRTYRRRSPSPRLLKLDAQLTRASGRESVATSRRSSPRPQLVKQEPHDDSRVYATSHRSPPRRTSPYPNLDYQRRDDSPSVRVESPGRQNIGEPDGWSRPSNDRESQFNDQGSAVPADIKVPPPPLNHKDGRAPPTGPAAVGRYGNSLATPPVGPASAPVSMSAHNRASNTAPLAYARGGGYRGRGGPSLARDFQPRDHPLGAGRPGWGGMPPYNRGGSFRDTASPRDTYPHEARPGPPPSRNRESIAGPPPLNFRGSSNNTSTTYPRTQRFNVPTSASLHLSDLPAIKAGGERMPSVVDTVKADRLEEEAARLRKLIDEKQEKKRLGLREWDGMERQGKTAGLRTELAEESLRGLSEEGSGLGVSGVAAF